MKYIIGIVFAVAIVAVGLSLDEQEHTYTNYTTDNYYPCNDKKVIESVKKKLFPLDTRPITIHHISINGQVNGGISCRALWYFDERPQEDTRVTFEVRDTSDGQLVTIESIGR